MELFGNSWVGWVANALLIIGLVCAGKKYKHAFLFTFLGEVVWLGISVHRDYLDMIVLCVVFAGIAFKNWISWVFDKEPSNV